MTYKDIKALINYANAKFGRPTLAKDSVIQHILRDCVHYNMSIIDFTEAFYDDAKDYHVDFNKDSVDDIVFAYKKHKAAKEIGNDYVDVVEELRDDVYTVNTDIQNIDICKDYQKQQKEEKEQKQKEEKDKKADKSRSPTCFFLLSSFLISFITTLFTITVLFIIFK